MRLELEGGFVNFLNCCHCRYQLAESVDGQLRRMEQDLKEIIEQMNSSNAAEDEDSPVCDVMTDGL